MGFVEMAVRELGPERVAFGVDLGDCSSFVSPLRCDGRRYLRFAQSAGARRQSPPLVRSYSSVEGVLVLKPASRSSVFAAISL